MKRYFIAPDGGPAIEWSTGNGRGKRRSHHSVVPPAIPQGFAGQWHGISLASHGDAGEGYHLIVLVDGHIEAPADWIALPPLLDARTTLEQSAVPHEVFVDIGLTGEETTLEAVVKLGDLHPLMGL